MADVRLEAVISGDDRRLGAIADAELPEDLPDVGLDGVDRQVQLVGDLTIGGALRQQRQDLTFTFGERDGDVALVDGRRPDELAAVHSFDRVDEFDTGRALHDHAVDRPHVDVACEVLRQIPRVQHDLVEIAVGGEVVDTAQRTAPPREGVEERDVGRAARHATGLGLVPYAIKHPRVLHAWASVRELALADVRSLAATPERCDRLHRWIDRVERHFASASDDDATPFLSPRSVAALAAEVRACLDRCDGDDAFDQLYRWSEDQHPECRELVVSLLIELHDGADDEIDRLLLVDEHHAVDPPRTASEALVLIADRFDWLDGLDLRADDADHFWWVLSDNNEEPRRVVRDGLSPRGRDLAIDVALRMGAYRNALGRFATGITIITTQVGDDVRGMTCNAFLSISLEPPLVGIAVKHSATMHGYLEQAGRYGVSVAYRNEVKRRHFLFGFNLNLGDPA